jgi:hypothetical protein
MTTLETVTLFSVPAGIVDATDKHLRAAGHRGAECFVLWSGVAVGTSFVVRTMHVPRQTAYRSPEGISVRVEGPELHRLNVWLFEHGEQLGVQVHSHPTQAYHSETDDAYPIVTVRGAVSIVVPDFALAGLRGPGVAFYRLTSSTWDEVPSREVTRLIQFTE